MQNFLLMIRLSFTIDKSESADILNIDLSEISKWAYNWKMLFNPDPSKPAQEVVFSRKKKEQSHPGISLYNIQVERTSYHKHLGLILDEKLNFKQHVDRALLKMNKGISVKKTLRYSLPRKYLLTIYKAFLRALIDYGDIIYDQPQIESFWDKIESVQYKAALAITGTMQGTSRGKLYQELALESLKSRRWYKPLSCIFKIMKKEAPNYLIKLIPRCEQTIRTRNNNIPIYHCRTDRFKYSFFLSTLNEWFKLDDSIRNSESIQIFKSKLLSLIRLVQSNIYSIFDEKGLKLLTRLRLGLSNLNEHKFRHNFQDCLNPLCSCSLEIDNTSHYLLHCHHFSNRRIDLMNNVNSIIPNFESMNDNMKKDTLLYGDSRFDENKNKIILEATINYLTNSERFSQSILK